jgi:hypothetical protein
MVQDEKRYTTRGSGLVGDYVHQIVRSEELSMPGRVHFLCGRAF